MIEEKDAYEKLPKETRDRVERAGKRVGMEPEQVHAEYMDAQAIVNPGPEYWNRNLFKRHRRRKEA